LLSVSVSSTEVKYDQLKKQIRVDNIFMRKRGILRADQITENELKIYYIKATQDTNLTDSTRFYEFTDSLMRKGIKIK